MWLLQSYLKTACFQSQIILDIIILQHIKLIYKIFLVLVEPRSFKEVAYDPQWIKAMEQEIQALEDNHTWEIVDLPIRKQAIGSK